MLIHTLSGPARGYGEAHRFLGVATEPDGFPASIGLRLFQARAFGPKWGKGKYMAYEKPMVNDLGSIAEHTFTGYFPGGSGIVVCRPDWDQCEK